MTVISSKAKNDYTADEIEFILRAKQNGMTDASIAKQSGRTYWSVVYKWQDIKKNYLKEDKVTYVY
ncbi:hypothetical protein [Exiguobacterium mexicanum]|uniref:hypothetical protein n=1 Tax=Exiguobacterium mexicanum TaxID=340146 RepID=UPI0037C0E53E